MFTAVPSWILDTVFFISERFSWLANFINSRIVHYTVSMAPLRPDPWSTVHPYVSWRSLTDLTWSARHLPPRQIEHLPDRDRLIEIFRARPSGQVECKKSTLLFPAFAQYLTDGIIRTVMPNRSEGDPQTLRKRNTSNHQFEMGTLYGRTLNQTMALRLNSERQGERGRMKSQFIDGEEYSPFLYDEAGLIKPEFATLDGVVNIDKATPENKRTLFAFGGDRGNVAPHVAMLNILFLREHNRIAAEIERRHPSWNDERVFETTRNTVIVLFIKIGVEEYINHITPLSFKMVAAPAIAWKALWNRPNRVAIEFSLMYRWHSLVPTKVCWGGQTLPVQDTLLNNKLLIDSGLAAAFENVSRQNAMRLGAKNTADTMLQFEQNAIEQSRLCDIASFSDYCAHMSTHPPQRFEDFSSDPEIVRLLSELYESPADVEFYVGLFAQDTLKNSPLPDLMLKLAAMDAFSHAFTNPLLSERAFQESTFSEVGWAAIHTTSHMTDVVARNVGSGRELGHIGMTRADWRQIYEIPVVDEFREALKLRTTKLGRWKLAAFFAATVGETAGLAYWLYQTMAGSAFAGFGGLVAGEALEWSILAVAIATSARSYPKRTGTIPGGLIKSALTSFSEAFLWIGWLLAINAFGLVMASLLLLPAMHVKHVTEITILTGRSFSSHAWDGRDILASVIETTTAAAWFWLWHAVSPVVATIVLFAGLFCEHLLQFKSGGFMAEEA
jgi:prostaglandin-endoperoxide synthase 2